MICSCGGNVKNPNHRMHVTSTKHQAWASAQEGVPESTIGQVVILDDQPDPEEIHPDIATILAFMDNAQADPKVRHIIVAREMRKLFAQNFWPNDEQPLTVAEILNKYNIPIETPARVLYARSEVEVSPPKVGETLIKSGVAVSN